MDNSWVAFAHQGKFYFVSIKSPDNLDSLEALIAEADAEGEGAEDLVKRVAPPPSLMSSVRAPCDPDNIKIIRARWAEEKAAGKWDTAAAKQTFTEKARSRKTERQENIL